MTHVLRCSCGKQLRVSDELAGKRAKCPACQKVLVVPAQPESGAGFQAGADARPVHTTPDDFAFEPVRHRDWEPDSKDRPSHRTRSSGALVGLGLAAVLIAAGVGVLIFLNDSLKEPKKPPSSPAPAPRPTVEVARAEPAEPKPGDTLVVELKGTSPSGEPLRYLFRTEPAGEWRPAPGPRLALADLKEGMLNLEVRAENDRDGASDVLSRSWMVGAGGDDAVWEGGVLKLKKVPAVTTDNQNRLVKLHRQQLQLSASSVWQGWPTDKALDYNIETSWFSAQNDAAALGTKPWVQATFPQDVRVSRVTILGNREPAWLVGYTILEGRLTLYDAGGEVLRDIPSTGTGNYRDFDFKLTPPVEGVRSVRFWSVKDQGNHTAHKDIAIAEFQIE